jgi:pyrroline-5-carboxylate reductase
MADKSLTRKEIHMKLGFIGCGNMAFAMIGGIISKGICSQEEIIASDAYEPALAKAAEELKIQITTDNKEVTAKADILFLSVKPQYYETVIQEIKDTVKENQIIVTIAPGKTLDWLLAAFGKSVKIVRCMPNTPALVCEGITGVCPNRLVEKDELELVCKVLSGFGKTEVLSENLMDAVVSVSGSSPAYVFMFIEAMADAAVADGMPRAQAYRFAAQAVYGSAKMVLETGKHPAELKDMVCSPGGTTIEAVRVLEKNGFRSAVIEAMKACTKKAKGL